VNSALRGNGFIALVFASILWGTTGTAAHFFPVDVSPLAIGAATMGVGGILLFAISARASIRAIRDPASLRWLAIGAVGVFVYPLAFYSAMSLAGVAIGNVVTLGSGPIFAAMFEWAFERRRPSAVWLGCTALAIVGIILLALAGAGRPLSGVTAGGAARGVLLALVAGCAYALYAYASSRAISAGATARGAIGGMFGIGAILLVPVLLTTGAPLLQSPLSVGLAAYLTLGPMVLAYLLFGIGVATLRSSTATTITLIEPLVATVLAVAVIGERLALVGWIGLVLILLGVVVIGTARHPDKTR
jgi:DME family drug/metabolite transporter